MKSTRNQQQMISLGWLGWLLVCVVCECSQRCCLCRAFRITNLWVFIL